MKSVVIFLLALLPSAPALLAQDQPKEPAQEDPPLAPTRAEIEATWKTACEWAVGSAAERVRAARARMIGYGRPGLDHVLTRISSEDGLELESIQAVVDGLGAAAADPLLDALDAENGEMALREGLHLLGVIRKKLEGRTLDRAAAFVLSRTKSDSIAVKLRALLVASDFGLRAAIPAAVSLSGHEKEGVRRGVAQILGRFGGEEAVHPLIAMLKDRMMTVRFPAQYSLAQCGAAAVPALVAAIGAEKDPVAVNHLLMALGATGTPQAPALVSAFLKSEDPIRRGFAVRALANWLAARQSALKSTADEPAGIDDLASLKEAALMLRAQMPNDRHHFVLAQIDEFDRVAGAIALLK